MASLWSSQPAGRCWPGLNFLSNCDPAKESPPGAKLLAGNAHCEVGMIRIGNMLGIQGHPEFPPDYAEALLKMRRELIGAVRTDEALATLDLPLDGPLLGNWARAFFASRQA